VQQPRTVAEVLERIHSTWAALHATFDGLSDQQLTDPGPEGWSVKDHLAHIMVWDGVPTTILRGQPQHRAFGLDQNAYDRVDSVDQLNAYIYEKHKDRPLADIRACLAQVHADLVAAVTRLTDADLDRSIADFGSDVDDKRPLRDKIEADSYGHYVEHTAWLAELRRVLVQEGR
jgi:hypothetical protein